VCDADTIRRHAFLAALLDYVEAEGLEWRSALEYLPDGLVVRPHLVNSRTHVPWKLKCSISLCTNPVSILSLLFKPSVKALNPLKSA
jgi:hypothetical protein